MQAPISLPIVRDILRLQGGEDYYLTSHFQSDEVATFRVESAANAAFHIIAVTDKLSQRESLPFIERALDDSPTVSAATCIDRSGAVHYAVRKNFRTGDIDFVGSSSGKSSEPSPTFWDLSSSSKLKPLTEKFENVLFEVHSALRDIDGMHAPEALDEICKLLIAKLDDERLGLGQFRRQFGETADECAAKVRKLYNQATNWSQQEDVGTIKGIFKDPIFATSSALARSVELLGPYDFSRSSMDVKGRAFQNVLLPAVRSGMGQYFTPKEVIDFIVTIMKPKASERVIDPFCGSGHFLSSTLEYIAANDPADRKKSDLHGIEKSDRMSRIAYMDFVLHGFTHCKVHSTDALYPFDNYQDIEPGSFDIVMTNPPFGVDLTHDALQSLDNFELAPLNGASVSFEILAVERCLQLLRPGGRLAIVLPDSVLSNKNTAHVRRWIERNAIVKAIISLPLQTFCPFGANIKTSVIVLSRRLRSDQEPSNVFLGIVDEVGYDSAGRPSSSSDLDDVAREFATFMEREGW